MAKAHLEVIAKPMVRQWIYCQRIEPRNESEGQKTQKR